MPFYLTLKKESHRLVDNIIAVTIYTVNQSTVRRTQLMFGIPMYKNSILWATIKLMDQFQLMKQGTIIRFVSETSYQS
jgi:hypothetical protein